MPIQHRNWCVTLCVCARACGVCVCACVCCVCVCVRAHRERRPHLPLLFPYSFSPLLPPPLPPSLHIPSASLLVHLPPPSFLFFLLFSSFCCPPLFCLLFLLLFSSYSFSSSPPLPAPPSFLFLPLSIYSIAIPFSVLQLLRQSVFKRLNH